MNYNRLVPHDSFMGRYLSYMQSQETAHIYDWWCGLFCISAACARFAYVDRPRAPVFLNLFVVLVGESGIPRKTTSVHMATRLVREVTGDTKEVGHIDAKVTPEKLEDMLHHRTMEHGNAQLCITVPELAVFLGTERYIANMPILLTDLYDCPRARDAGGTLRRGTVNHRNVWLSFLSASTPVWLLKTVNPNVVEGGFTSRCYFVVSNTPKRKIAWPEAVDEQLFQDLLDDMRILAQEARQRKAIQLSEPALAAFAKWYETREHSIDPFKQSFEAREDAHILRIAALLSVNDGSWLIKRSHIAVAIRVIHEIKRTSSAIFESTETRTKFAAAFDVMRAALMSAGMDPLPRHVLYRKCKTAVNHEDFMTLLEVMHEIGAVQRFAIQGDMGRPTDYIRGTNLLLSRGLGETVLERFI